MNITRIFKNSEGNIRIAWRMLIFFVSIIAVYLVVIGIGIVIYVVYYLLVNAGILPELSDENRDWVIKAFIVPINVPLTLALLFLLRKFIDRKKIFSIGIVKPTLRVVRRTAIGLAIGIITISIYLLVMVVAGQYTLSHCSIPWLSIALIPILILAAFEEELIFRGYIFQNFLDENKVFTGIIFSSFLFSLVHCGNPSVFSNPLNLLNLFFAGIVLAQTYQISNDLWFPTAIHFTWNAAQGLMYGLPISGLKFNGFLNFKSADNGDIFFSGGEFGPEGSYIVSIILVLWMIGNVVFLLEKKSEGPKVGRLEGH